jgi:hypothetical protein
MTIDEYIINELLKQQDECLRIINSKHSYTDEDRKDSKHELKLVKEELNRLTNK